MSAAHETVREGRPLRLSLMLLIGVPMLIGLAVQGVLAVKSGNKYEAALAQVMIDAPAAAAPLAANIAAQKAQSKVMAPASIVALGLGLLVAFVVARRMAARFARLQHATQRMAEGHLGDEIAALRDVEFDPLVDDFNTMRKRLMDRLELEIEQAELGKALELGAEVQRMFLPSDAELGHQRIRAGFGYRPATTCGGDFWYSHVTTDGRLLVFVGDVTGHGSAAAVVTAAVSAQIRMQLARSEQPDVTALLTRLNASVLDLCGSSYRMTMSVLEISADGESLRYYSAGAPPLVVREPTGHVDVITVAGAPLGSARFCAAKVERKLSSGARIHVFTDGVVEAERADGRAFGLKRLAKEIDRLGSTPVAQVSDALLGEIITFASDAAQDDDWTMVALEVA